MDTSRDNKGFTLVELAIVIVIIGIILGAVIKGQDLVENSRHKKFVARVKEWENAAWTFFDRKGKFPGDTDRDGIIDTGNVKADLTAANFIYPPYEGTAGNEVNSITVGSNVFYVYLGMYDGTVDRNLIVVCADMECKEISDETKRAYLESFDAVIDGFTSGTHGQVRSCNGGISPQSASWIVKIPGDPGYIGEWSSTTRALLYFFDGKGL